MILSVKQRVTNNKIFEYVCIFFYKSLCVSYSNSFLIWIYRYSFVSKSCSDEYMNISIFVSCSIRIFICICIVLFFYSNIVRYSFVSFFHTDIFVYSFVSFSWYDYIRIFVFNVFLIRLYSDIRLYCFLGMNIFGYLSVTKSILWIKTLDSKAMASSLVTQSSIYLQQNSISILFENFVIIICFINQKDLLTLP